MLIGLDGMEEAWNRARMESGRRAGKAGGISGALFMGSPVFGSVSIVRRAGDIFGKRWSGGFGLRGWVHAIPALRQKAG